MNKKIVRRGWVFFCFVMLVAAGLVSGRHARPVTPEVNPTEMRCGWFSNPTPANASLYDREAEWIIGVQGGHQAEGDWPSFRPGQWVKTNGNYGHGCACLRVRVNPETHEVMEIESARARPLAVCRNDRSLRRWDFK
jgi:hypothetical protein